MSFRIRYTRAARDDLLRLFAFLAARDPAAARHALEMIRKSMTMLQDFPFSCRKADPDNPFLREMVIAFGSRGYVALFEIEGDGIITVLAVRHQREEDYY